ncbi:hypothetical protein OA77_24420 [Pseudomonas coronafaciens]|nr:hypothetical protein OA77_24420 [Pseudomonas coronafaciens]
MSYLVFAGELGWGDFWLTFAAPTLAGNIIGGSFIFALISHAQIRSEKDTTARMERDRKNKAEKIRLQKAQQLKDADAGAKKEI